MKIIRRLSLISAELLILNACDSSNQLEQSSKINHDEEPVTIDTFKNWNKFYQRYLKDKTIGTTEEALIKSKVASLSKELELLKKDDPNTNEVLSNIDETFKKMDFSKLNNQYKEQLSLTTENEDQPTRSLKEKNLSTYGINQVETNNFVQTTIIGNISQIINVNINTAIPDIFGTSETTGKSLNLKASPSCYYWWWVSGGHSFNTKNYWLYKEIKLDGWSNTKRGNAYSACGQNLIVDKL